MSDTLSSITLSYTNEQLVKHHDSKVELSHCILTVAILFEVLFGQVSEESKFLFPEKALQSDKFK